MALAEEAASQPDAVGDEATAWTIKAENAALKAEYTVDGQMTYKGLTVKIPLPPDVLKKPGSQRDILRLQTVGPKAARFLNQPFLLSARTRHRQPLPIPPELMGMPGLVTVADPHHRVGYPFELSKPARVYAYIHWNARPMSSLAPRADWHLYQLDPRGQMGLYWRDFPAGRNTIVMDHSTMIGMGICPLDQLTDRQKIVPMVEMINEKPMLTVYSDYDQPQALKVACVVRPAVESEWGYESRQVPPPAAPVFEGTMDVTAAPGWIRQPLAFFDQLDEGIMYWADVTVSGPAGGPWEISSPMGRFPAPADPPALDASILPYGVYLKLNVNSDPEIYNRMLAGTFYYLRRMHYNTVVLEMPVADRVALAEKYGLKMILRLGYAPVPEAMLKSPSVLAYMISDEPAIGPKLDHCKRMYDLWTRRIGKGKFVTSVMLDHLGHGTAADPALLLSKELPYLGQYDIIRYGRLYTFRKESFGLMRPSDYKMMLSPTAVFTLMEADKERPWWLAVPLFGTMREVQPWWRIPTGPELTGLMHLALAHRCSGLMGYAVHTHSICYSVCLDGYTMAVTRKNLIPELTRFGQQLIKAQKVLAAFTAARRELDFVRPYEIDAAARWLRDGRIAVYVVNRDVDNAQAASMELLMGGAAPAGSEKVGADDLIAEIVSIRDAFSGKEIPHKTVQRGQYFWVRMETPEIAPGDAMLLVLSGSASGGGFRNLPDVIRKRLEAENEQYQDID